MSAVSFLLVIAAAVCHATWNFSVKRLNAGPELVWLFSAVAMVIYLPFALLAAYQSASIGPVEIVFILGSVAIHLAYFLLLQLGYRRGDLSLVYPTARATGPILATIIAIALLGETATLQGILGGVIIVGGVLMMTGGFRRPTGNGLPSLLFGLGAGVLIGSYTTWDAYTVATLAVSPMLLDYASSVGRTVLLAPVAYRRWDRVRVLWQDHRLDVCIIAVFSPLAYILVLVAMTTTPVIYVAPLRELSVLLVVLLGSIYLNEGHLRHRLTWAGVTLVGTVLLATS